MNPDVNVNVKAAEAARSVADALRVLGLAPLRAGYGPNYLSVTVEDSDKLPSILDVLKHTKRGFQLNGRRGSDGLVRMFFRSDDPIGQAPQIRDSLLRAAQALNPNARRRARTAPQRAFGVPGSQEKPHTGVSNLPEWTVGEPGRKGTYKEGVVLLPWALHFEKTTEKGAGALPLLR